MSTPTDNKGRRDEVTVFRRSEDWERLTRLEFLVEELVRDNERRDVRLDHVTETQTNLRHDMDQIIRYARDIRMLTIGGVFIGILFLFGAQKVIPALFSVLLTGV